MPRNLKEFLESYINNPYKEPMSSSDIEEYKKLKEEYKKIVGEKKFDGTFVQWINSRRKKNAHS